MKFKNSSIKGELGRVLVHNGIPLLPMGNGRFIDLSQVFFDSFSIDVAPSTPTLKMTAQYMTTEAFLFENDEKVAEPYYFKEVWECQDAHHLESGHTQKKKKASKTS